jgi:hypothetical protein
MIMLAGNCVCAWDMKWASKTKENIQSSSVRGTEHFVSLKRSVVSTKLRNFKFNIPTDNWHHRIFDGISGMSYKLDFVINGYNCICVSNFSGTCRVLFLTFWRRNYFFLILAHSVYKMWIIQEPNMLELLNKQHFEEKKTESIYLV